MNISEIIIYPVAKITFTHVLEKKTGQHMRSHRAFASGFEEDIKTPKSYAHKIKFYKHKINFCRHKNKSYAHKIETL